MAEVKERKCPNCGAPLPVPQSSYVTALTCSYCKIQVELPRPPVRVVTRTPPIVSPKPSLESEPNSQDSFGTLTDRDYKQFGWYFLGAFILAVAVFAAYNGLKRAEKDPPPRSAKAQSDLPPPPVPEPEPAPEEVPLATDPDGRNAVDEQLARLKNTGCRKVLLFPSTVVGTQEVETKFIANKRCVRILASTGDLGDPIELFMQTPRRKKINTPEASPNLHFVYCPQKTGRHPLRIEAIWNDAYTVAAIECP